MAPTPPTHDPAGDYRPARLAFFEAQHETGVLRGGPGLTELFDLEPCAQWSGVVEDLGPHVAQEDRADFLAAFRREAPGTPESERSAPRCFRVRTAAGGWRRLCAFRYGRAPAGVTLGVLVDATAELQLLERLQLAEALAQETNRIASLGVAARSVLHDLNTIMAVVFAGADLLRSPLLPADQREVVLQDLRQAAEQGVATVRGLSGIARQTEPVELVDLAPVLHHVRRVFARLLGPEVDFEVHAAEHLPLLRAPRGALVRAVLALLLEAREAAGSTGRIRLTAHAGPRPDLVDIEVQDDGTCLDLSARLQTTPAALDAVRGGPEPQPVHALAQSLGGRLSVETRQARWTSVCLSLPASAAPPPVDVSVGEELAARTGRRVLLVVREEALRQMLARALESQGCAVVAVAHLPAAEARWRQGFPADAVVVKARDARAPEAVRRWAPHVPVVALVAAQGDVTARPRLAEVVLPCTGQAIRAALDDLLEAGARQPS